MSAKISPVLIVAVAFFTLAVAAGAASDLWLHVKVDEDGGAKVSVNLPISMLEKALEMIPEEEFGHGNFNNGMLEFDDWHMSAGDMRELWLEVKDGPDMTFVTVEDHGESVRVWKESGYLYVNVREDDDGDTVDVRVPFAVVDALLSGEDGQLDIGAAMRALAEEGEGELVAVSSDDEQVRVWVDSMPEAE